ncbi:MAG: hypothetical protein ACPGU7_13055 [Gammaproteobacteria bacterium]
MAGPTTDADQQLIADFIRVARTERGEWCMEVGVLDWPSGHQPEVCWKSFRTWKREPDAEQIERASHEALEQARFFAVCQYCQRRCNRGYMESAKLCQGCAAERFGVVY